MKLTTGFLLMALPNAATSDDGKPANSPPKLFVIGKSIGRVTISETTGAKTSTLKVTILEIGGKSKLAVALPPESGKPSEDAKGHGVDPDLENAVKDATGGRILAVDGILRRSTNSVLIAVIGAKNAKSVPLVFSETLTEVTDANRKEFPWSESIRVMGVLARRENKVGDKTSTWAIRGSVAGDVPLLSNSVDAAKEGKQVLVVGQPQISDGRLSVKVETIEVKR